VHAARIFANLLGGGMASRLFQEVREKRGLCYAVSSFHWSFADTGLFGMHAATGESQVAELVPVMMDVLAAAAADATPEELARAKAQARAGLLMSLESSSARADRLARQILSYGRLRAVEEIVADIDAVTIDAVRDFAAEMLGAGLLAFASVGEAGAVEAKIPH
jgi:predicted Zn-dependent peptidase